MLQVNTAHDRTYMRRQSFMVLMAGNPGEKNIPNLKCGKVKEAFPPMVPIETNVPNHSLVVHQMQNIFGNFKVSIARPLFLKVPEDAGAAVAVST